LGEEYREELVIGDDLYSIGTMALLTPSLSDSLKMQLTMGCAITFWAQAGLYLIYFFKGYFKQTT
jgi:hypothetical protein